MDEPAPPGDAATGGTPPRRVGRYEVTGELGHGGMGEVLRGRDPGLGREVAVKLLSGAHGLDPDRVRRFLTEARIAGQLQHPGIAPVHELSYTPEGVPHFSMKLVEGETLQALLDARPMPGHDQRRFLAVFEQVCQTVAYAHSSGVIHRDLKPSNIMVGAFGEVQVVDWGLAKLLTPRSAGGGRPEAEAAGPWEALRAGSASASQAGSVMGTFEYMPPEQARGEVDRLDERADVFALGAVLCQILTGQPAYVATGKEDLPRKAAGGDLDDALRRLRGSGAEEGLVRIALGCLVAEPDGRFRDAGVVARNMSAFLSSVEERARASEREAAEARATAAEERRARRLTMMLSVSVLLGLLVCAGIYALVVRDRRLQREAIAREIERAVGEATVLWGEAKAGTDVAAWTAAAAAASRAESLAQSPSADHASRGQVGGLAAEIERGHARARQAAEQEGIDRRMEEVLDGITYRFAETDDAPRMVAEYEAAFRGHGIDHATLAEGAAAGRVRASRIAARLGAGLDDWALLEHRRGGDADLSKKLIGIARAADPDAIRNRIRDASQAGDLTGLRELATQPEAVGLPPRTLDLLGGVLGRRGDVAAAVALYRMAFRRHPDEFAIHANLAHWPILLEPPQTKEAVRHASAALGLRPRSLLAWRGLAGVLLRDGSVEEAIATLEKGLELKPDDPQLLGTLEEARKQRKR